MASGYGLLIIATVLLQCHTGEPKSYYQWAISFFLFFRLSSFLLLVVVVYTVNDLFRKYHGHNPVYFKIIYGVILGVIGALTCAFIGVICSNQWKAYDSYPDY